MLCNDSEAEEKKGRETKIHRAGLGGGKRLVEVSQQLGVTSPGHSHHMLCRLPTQRQDSFQLELFANKNVKTAVNST